VDQGHHLVLHSDAGRPARFQSDPVARRPRPGSHIRQDTGHRAWSRGARAPLAASIAAPRAARGARSAEVPVCETARMIVVPASVALYLLATGLLVAEVRRGGAGRAWLPP